VGFKGAEKLELDVSHDARDCTAQLTKGSSSAVGP
jgi:hypothetical protein